MSVTKGTRVVKIMSKYGTEFEIDPDHVTSIIPTDDGAKVVMMGSDELSIEASEPYRDVCDKIGVDYTW